MKSDFELIIEECLAQMRAGKALEECLSDHPSHAEELRPLLQAAVRVWGIPVPRARPSAVQAGRERLLASANFQRTAPTPVSSGRFSRYTKQVLGTLTIFPLGNRHPSLNFAFRMAAILVIVLLATGGITVKASASSLPGDKLYPVKRTWEALRLSTAINQQRKQQLIEQFATERRDEVKELIQLHRAETVEFQAPLEKIDAEHWVVDGFQIQIDPETTMEGQPETGGDVDVRARLESDGTLIAIQVRASSGTQPSPFPTVSPTPPSEEDSETQDFISPQDQYTPHETPQPTEGENNEEDQGRLQPTHTPEQQAAHTPQIQSTSTPEPADQHENQHTPDPTESHHPTETHKPAHTPDPTEEHHETPESTEEP
jgi:hypothetical protein